MRKTDGPVILVHLLAGTGTTSSALSTATIALYRHFVQSVHQLHCLGNSTDTRPPRRSSVIVYAGDKVTAPLEAYLSAFDAPLGSLAKRAKKGPGPLSSSELAFFALCDILSTTLGDFERCAPVLDSQ